MRRGDSSMAKISIEADSLEEVREILREKPRFPEGLVPLVQDIERVLEAVERAKSEDPRGRAKRKIAEYAGIRDAAKVGEILRLLERHRIVQRESRGRWKTI